MRVLSVNFDGMNSPLYDSLQLWLDTAPYDVLLMQETYRGFGGEYNEWQAGERYIISSPDVKPRFAGVAKRFARHYGVRSLEVVPGRLLHVRLTGKLYSIDLLSCCQHVISSRDSASANASRREQYWNKLGSYVAGLPRRNILLLGGDFNRAARKEPGVAGYAAPDRNPYYFDQDDFIGFAKANSLCLLNTWSRDVDTGMHTFLNGQSNSQIDYIMNKEKYSGFSLQTVQATPLPQLFALEAGCKALPIQASVPLKPGRSSIDKAPTQSHPAYDKAALELSIHQHDRQAQQLVQEVQQGLGSLCCYAADSLNHLLLSTCAKNFSCRQNRSTSTTMATAGCTNLGERDVGLQSRTWQSRSQCKNWSVLSEAGLRGFQSLCSFPEELSGTATKRPVASKEESVTTARTGTASREA